MNDWIKKVKKSFSPKQNNKQLEKMESFFFSRVSLSFGFFSSSRGGMVSDDGGNGNEIGWGYCSKVRWIF